MSLSGNEYVTIRFTFEWGPPKRWDLEIEIRNTASFAERVLMHLWADIELLPLDPGAARWVRESALGKPFARAVNGAKLTKADAARQATLEYVQKKWLPANFRLKVDPLSQAQSLLMRNRDAGDLNGDGKADYTF